MTTWSNGGPVVGPNESIVAFRTAWESLPKLVRLAVWLWSLIFVVSVVISVVVGAILGLALIAGLSG